MKKKIIFILLLLFTVNGYTQKKEERRPVCFADELMAKALKENPELQSYLDEMDMNITDFNANTSYNNKSLQSEQGMITIPVVIYIVHKGVNHPSNISDNQAQSQIEALNEHFNPWGIQFCLAKRYMGNPPIPPGPNATQTTPGIIHIDNPVLSDHNMNTDMEALGELPFALITPDKYLRIWVVNSITGSSSGTVGYATFPGISNVFDGVVMRYDVFGDSTNPLCTGCQLYSNNNKGKILVHEIGHYLGLYHTFHDGCSGMTAQTCNLQGDRVCDTPPSNNPNSSCLSIDSCVEDNNQPDDKHNFMSYGSDNCMNHFTLGQFNRMWSLLNLYRNELFTMDNLIYTGTCGSENLLSATFSIDSVITCSGGSIDFSPLVTGTNITYNWNFGDPSSGTNNTSTLQNPIHIYNYEGFYIVTLTISNGNQTTVDTKQLFVKDCEPILNHQSNWYLTTSNMLDFSSGVPISNNNFPLGLNAEEGCASQSNELGELLFYTNGVRVWDNTNTLINPNNLLFGSTIHSFTHGRKGVLIVPNPGNQNQYYIFTLEHTRREKGFRYSIVNVNGLTPTMSSTINEPITFPTGYISGDDGALIGGGEGITAVPHCDGFWIITTLQKLEYSSLVVYSLTSSGLSFNSELDMPLLTPDKIIDGTSVKISPDGNKLLCSRHIHVPYPDSYLYNFNKNEGVIDDDFIILSNTYGAEFSPNSKLLYQNEMGSLYQYNLNSTDIPATKKNIGLISLTSGTSDLQLGPDNKIYIANQNKKQLGVVHSPNELATENNPNACNFNLNGPILKANISMGLPNMINLNTEISYNNTITVIPISCLTYKFFANVCTDNFSWNFGDPVSGVNNISSFSSPDHTFSNHGNYTVTFTSGNTTITYELIVGISVIEISGSNTACLETNNLSSNSIALLSGQTINWSITGGAGVINGFNNQSSLIVHWSSLPGIVSATVTDQNGCITTVSKTIYEDCNFDIIEDCDGDVLTLTSPAASSEIYRVSDRITTQNNYSVGNNYSADLFAMNVIEIKPNSHIKLGSEFLAKIELCFTIAEKNKKMHQNFNLDSNVFLYPNPTKDYINIEIANDMFKNIHLFSMDGKLLLENNLKETNNCLLDLSYYKTGVCILKIYTSKGEEIIRKIIKE